MELKEREQNWRMECVAGNEGERKMEGNEC